MITFLVFCVLGLTALNVYWMHELALTYAELQRTFAELEVFEEVIRDNNLVEVELIEVHDVPDDAWLKARGA